MNEEERSGYRVSVHFKNGRNRVVAILRGVAKYGSRGVEVKGFHWLMARRGHHSCHSISVHAKRAHISAREPGGDH